MDSALEQADARAANEQRRAGIAAARTLENMGYVWEGGELWKPPLGRAYDPAEQYCDGLGLCLKNTRR